MNIAVLINSDYDAELTAGTGADGKPYAGDTNVEDVMLKVVQKRWPCTR
jgi:hypothetical protein